MQRRSLIGHLAVRFSAHPENLATEALWYILSTSGPARMALLGYLEQTGTSFPPALTFKTQSAGEDDAIPDLVAVSPDGGQPLVIEAKFWAGLTGNQPVVYLERLPTVESGLLLFVAPAKRRVTLWNELMRRLAGAGHAVQAQRGLGEELRSVAIDEHRSLALCSWRSLLTALLRAVETEGDHHTASDLRQLQGLCDRMDQQAFLPLRSEELTGDSGRRIVQLCNLVDDITNQLVADGLASTKGLRAVGGSGWYGRYVLLHGNGCLIHFTAHRWDRLAATPLWLLLKGHNWEVTPSLLDRVSELEHSDPTRLYHDDDGPVVPLYLPFGAERPGVLSALLDQLQDAVRLLEPTE